MGEEIFYQSINTIYAATCIVCELNSNYPIDTYISIASAQIGYGNDTVYVYLNMTRFCADSYVLHQLNFETVLSSRIHESSFNMRQFKRSKVFAPSEAAPKTCANTCPCIDLTK